MTQKKKKSTAANNLIESLMDDLRDVGAESISESISSDNQNDLEITSSVLADLKKGDPDKTQALPSAPIASAAEPTAPPMVKVSYGVGKASSSTRAPSTAGSIEGHLQQAENLRIAQNRILDLEQQFDSIRVENDQLSSSLEVARSRFEESAAKLSLFEKNRLEAKEQAAIEQSIFRENIQSRDAQIDRLKQKIEVLESRLQGDMKKIRVRERELENRLELSKAEKNALVRSKDETILELKRKVDQVTSELDESAAKCQELIQKIEVNQEQFSRTVRALRLALTNLEAHEGTSSINISSLKKAE